MNQKTMFFVCIILFGTVVMLSAETALDLDTAVALALEHNLGLNRTRIETAGKKRESDRSWNNLLPSINAGANVRRGTSLTGDLPPGGDEWTPGLSLSASVSLSPAVIATMKKTKTDYEVGIISYEGAKQELELEVRKLFYQLLLIHANVELAEESIASAQARYEEASARSKVGQASNLDELSARVELENLKPDLRSAETQYVNALEGFKQILGLGSDEVVQLEGQLEVIIPGALPEGISETRKQESWTITALRKSLESLEIQRKILWNQAYMPNLQLSWNSAPAYSNDVFADSSGSFSVGIGINLDSFLPGSGQRTKIDAVDDSLKIYRSQIQEALLNQDMRIRQLQRSIGQSIETIEALTLNGELAERTYEMWSESYRRGTADMQQLRAAGDSLLQAKNRVKQEFYNLVAASLDLEKELNIPFGSLWQ
ncbi:TolC family protein [Treponema primitia]|uniref:TolC family protein n=1 Tax=Treponema primitia TaxID=88058 RepID=UPI003980B455